MSTELDPPQRDRWARLRFSIIGPLLAAPPAPRELSAALTALAAKSWRHPLSGLDVRFGVSTLERWYYTARAAADPVAALRNRLRGNIGRFPSLTPAAIDGLTTQYREHPGWTAQLHFDNLRVALAGSRFAAAVLPDGATLPQGAGDVPSGSAQTRHRRRAVGPRSARTTGGQELRGRPRVGPLASRFPSRLTQGADAHRHLGQADAARRHRRSLAPGLPPAVVSRRNAPRAWFMVCRRPS